MSHYHDPDDLKNFAEFKELAPEEFKGFVELDSIVCEAEHAKTTTDLDLGSWQIPAGCVAGVAAS